jgi:outer membrane protein TolC
MYKKSLLFILSILICFFTHSKAQDTLRTLNAEQVLQLVRQFHPVVRIANIGVEKSKAEILNARSAFDPIIRNYISQKTFDGVNYYNYQSPEIAIPTWYGIEVYGGLENITGNRIDESITIGKTNYVGVSIPLLKNLLIDKRRAALQQAKIFNDLSVVEQQATINDLLLESMQAYWTWVKAYQTYLIIKNNVAINEKRVELVKKSYINGERPAIDTTEAITQLQSFLYLQNMSYLEFQNAGLDLSAYLWKSNNEPYTLPETVIPQEGWGNETNISNFNLDLVQLLDKANTFHPDLIQYQFKLDFLTIEKRLKFQELLPKLDFSYNQLGKGYTPSEISSITPLFENNYQYGLKMEIPLRFSKGRGEYKIARLKIEETQLFQTQKQLAIQIKVKSSYNEFVNYRNQIALQSSNYSYYQQLVNAEQSRFFNGESSLFMVNSRENKALEALEKLIELKTKYYLSIYKLQWSAGLLK